MPQRITKEQDALYTMRQKQLIRILGGKCHKCGSTKNLHVIHTFDDGRILIFSGGVILEDDDLIEAQQHPEKYSLSCYKHSPFHCDFLDFLEEELSDDEADPSDAPPDFPLTDVPPDNPFSEPEPSNSAGSPAQ